MNSITPGPWFTEKDGKRWTVRACLSCSKPNQFKTFELCRMSGDREDAEANARAIAAVPEMIELLKDIAEFGSCESSEQQAAALLSRIEGEEEK